MFGKNRRSVVALPSLALLAACVTERTALAPTPIALTPVEVQDTTAKSNSTDDLEFPDAPTPDAPTPDESTQSLALSEPPAQKSPKEFALELVKMMGTSPAKCGAAANNTPQVNWTCAPYTGGLGTFITNWDQLIKSAEFSLTHSYTATSDWMYFAIDGEIDFFYKTYDLETFYQRSTVGIDSGITGCSCT